MSVTGPASQQLTGSTQSTGPVGATGSDPGVAPGVPRRWWPAAEHRRPKIWRRRSGPRRNRARGGRFACGWHRSNTRTAPCRMVVVARPGTAGITISGEHGRRRRSESLREWARGHERARGRAGRAPGNTRSTMEGSDGGHGSSGHDGDGAGRR